MWRPLNPWKFTAIVALVSLGGILLACLGITLAFGWFLLLALILRYLWNFVFSVELTQKIFGSPQLSYLKALAIITVIYIVSAFFANSKEKS